MSGTAGMLGALKDFNANNTGSYFPDLYKLKLQILNTNKKGLTDAKYTYTPRAAATVAIQISEYKFILAELKRLFPDYNLYCTKTNLINTDPIPDTGTAAASNVYFLYTTGSQPALSSSTTKDYIWYIYIPCLNKTLSTVNTGSWST
jgi:hypothetical protein